MEKKRGKVVNRARKIARLSFLILLKEGWLLVGRFYGLVFWPVATVRDLARKKDSSQVLLLLGALVGPILFLTVFLAFLAGVEQMMGWELRWTWVLGGVVWNLVWGGLVALGLWVGWRLRRGE